jgi:hypothetical protein
MINEISRERFFFENLVEKPSMNGKRELVIFFLSLISIYNRSVPVILVNIYTNGIFLIEQDNMKW